MNQHDLADIIHRQTAAIAALERRIGTHATIRLILRALALKELTTAQALSILIETAERSSDPEQQALYQQAMDALQQLQADES